jgi:hypothetical protein
VAAVYLLLFLLLLLGLGLALAERWARDRQRRQVPWILGTMAAGGLGYAVGALFIARALRGTGQGAGLVLLAALAAPILATAFQAAVLALLHHLPALLPRLEGDRWDVFRVGTGGEAGGECQLRLDASALVLGQATIPLADLVQLAVDGECLKVRWRTPAGEEAEMLLVPTVPDPSAEGLAARTSQALLRRIEEARARR